MMDKTNWNFWRTELASPTPLERREDRETNHRLLSGYYRMEAAKSKPDWPVFIWNRVGEDHSVFQIGGMKYDTSANPDKWEEFASSTWLKCRAVSRDDFEVAINPNGPGRWPDDQKPSRHISEAERHGIDVTEGDNAAPVDQSINDQIEALVEKADALKVTNADEARIANETAEKLNVLFKLGDAERVKAKASFDEGAKAVQAKWLPIINPAADARERLVHIVKAFLRAEQAKLDAARIVTPPDANGRSEPAPRARAASTFGRATGLRKVPVAAVENPLTLCQYFIEQNDAGLADYLQSRAAAALRGKVTLPGCISREELQ